MTMTQEFMMSMPLDTAKYWKDQGLMTENEWLAYKHLWQTSAPRFALRVCQCPECKVNYPDTEYKTESFR